MLGKCPSVDNTMKYLVQFEGYSPSEAMWLEEKMLNERALDDGRLLMLGIQAITVIQIWSR